MRGEHLPITATDDATRDFTYVEDIVDALLRAAYFEAAIGQEMNIASGVETNIVQMAKKINDALNNTAGIRYAQRRVWDTKRRLLASIERANQLLGYRPAMDFDTGLQNTIRWFEAHWKEIQASAEFPPGMSSATRPVEAKLALAGA
jgi:nucleoside-diphosphate-sugar epimerase